MAQVLGSNSSGSGTSGSRNSSGSSLDPEIKSLFMENVSRAKDVANNLGVQQFAPRTGDYNLGQTMVRDTAAPTSVGMGAINQGVNLTGQNALASSVDNINKYLNPYTDFVAGNTMNMLGRANSMALDKTRGDAIANKAFGGSRSGIAEAETNRNFFDMAGKTMGDIYNTAYTNAIGQSSNDLGRQLQASGQLVNAGGAAQTAGYQGAQNVMNLGLMDQDYQQKILDATRNLPLEQQAIINQALGINPGGGSGMVSSSTGSSESQQSSKSGSGLFGIGSFF